MVPAVLDARPENDQPRKNRDQQGNIGTADEVKKTVEYAARRGQGLCPAAQEDERDRQQDRERSPCWPRRLRNRCERPSFVVAGCPRSGFWDLGELGLGASCTDCARGRF